MSRLADEVREPWGLLVAGLLGGLAWATGVVPIIAVGVGAAAFVTKVVAGLATRGSEEPELRLLPVAPRSDESRWLERASDAHASVLQLCRGLRPGPIAERLGTIGTETSAALTSLRRLAGQASAVGMALLRIDPRRLVPERDRLAAAVANEDDPRLRAEQHRSLAAVQSQLDALSRLQSARETLLARMESGTLGLEGLVTRLAEVMALAETSGTVADTSQVDSLASELEGLRAGLSEAEAVTTNVLEPLDLAPPDSVRGVRQKGPGS